MIRRAVGIVATHQRKFLLVYKIMAMDRIAGPESIPGVWDFPKGGVRPDDADLAAAAMRELREETGSDQYRLVREFPERICFTFTPRDQEKLGYLRQETVMFHAEYQGNGEDLHPQDDEIAEARFVSAEQALAMLAHQESRDFFATSFLPFWSGS